jgi:hypothetical protein
MPDSMERGRTIKGARAPVVNLISGGRMMELPLRLEDFFDSEGKPLKKQHRAKLRPAKQRANQKQAKVWATKVARKEKNG